MRRAMGLSETMRGTRRGWVEQEALSLPSLPPVCKSCHSEHQPETTPLTASSGPLCPPPPPPSSEEGKEGMRAEAVALTQGPRTCFLVSISGHKRKV